MTPANFFEAIQVPVHWKYLGRNNAGDGDNISSYGLVYELDKSTKMKLFFMPYREKGGLVKETQGMYDMLLDNHTPEEINEYLREFYDN